MRAVRSFGSGVAIAAALFVSPSSAAAQTWREVKTPHFTVISDASERRAQHIAWQFEQMRAAIHEGLPWIQVALDRPVLVIAVRDENAMRAIAPQYWEERRARPVSVFVGGPDRHYIALRADAEVESQTMNPHNAAYRAYSSLTLNQSMGRSLPLWLTNGLATVLSNSVVRSREVVFGMPMPWTLQTLKESPRMPLAELLAVEQSSPTYRSAIGRERFDAQTWSLVQYMMFGFKDNAIGRFDRMLGFIAGGMSSDAAIDQAYGGLAAFETAYTLHVQTGLWSYISMPTQADIVEAKLPVRVMSVAEHALARASFHAAMNRPVEARSVAATARKGDPASPIVDDIEGKLLDREQQTAQAAEAFARATAAGSTSYWSYYRLATLRSQPGAGADAAAEIESLLTRATEIEPSFAPAFSFLSITQVNRGSIEPALASARRAVAIDPGNASYRITLARMLAQAGRNDEALAEAREAAPLARLPQERAALETLLTSLGAAGPR